MIVAAIFLCGLAVAAAARGIRLSCKITSVTSSGRAQQAQINTFDRSASGSQRIIGG